MAFPGTEVLEVAPKQQIAVCSGGGKVFAVSSGVYGEPGTGAVLDTATGTSLLYSMPTYRSSVGISVHAAYHDAKAWILSSNSAIDGGQLVFGSLSTTGLSSISNGWGPYSYNSYVMGVLACDGYIHGVYGGSGFTSWGWGRLDLSTGTSSAVTTGSYSPPVWFAAAVGSTIYDTNGTATVTAWNAKRDTSGSSWVLPAAAQSPGVAVGTVIWWQAAAGMVWLDTATGTTGGLAATPGTGYPASNRKPAILGDVAYWIHSDNTKMVAFNLSTGQWKLDDLATSRSGRTGVGVGAGKLWIPSTVTP